MKANAEKAESCRCSGLLTHSSPFQSGLSQHWELAKPADHVKEKTKAVASLLQLAILQSHTAHSTCGDAES